MKTIFILPLLLFCPYGISYSLRIGYLAINEYSSFVYPVLFFLIASLIACASIYFYLQPYKEKEEIWWFELNLKFLLNGYAFLLYATSIGFYLYGEELLTFSYANTLLFIITFSTSIWSFAGAIYSEKFIENSNIRITY